MRKEFLQLIVIICSLSSFFLSFVFGASISGTVAYSGSQTGTILVAAFDSVVSCSDPNYGDDLTFTTRLNPLAAIMLLLE